ncbi:hypothetical protein N431DRAFT_230901 [Stipitochalara longipes BDJ]|nr:hypothetical protein N431DRAFT_230901 [Stipitochalara longipes BDJ]
MLTIVVAAPSSLRLSYYVAQATRMHPVTGDRIPRALQGGVREGKGRRWIAASPTKPQTQTQTPCRGMHNDEEPLFLRTSPNFYLFPSGFCGSTLLVLTLLASLTTRMLSFFIDVAHERCRIVIFGMA